MTLLPFEPLPTAPFRRFLAPGSDLGDWTSIAPQFDRLERQASECLTTEALERWLMDWSELTAALEEEGSKRYIAMTCRTDDVEAEAAYLRFVEEIEPRTKPRQFLLAKIFTLHPLRRTLPPARYHVFDRATALQVRLFRDENVALETEEARVGQQYQKVCGGLTVVFRGEERTLAQMGRFLEEPDRDLREAAWRLSASRRLAEKDVFEDQFEELLKWRHQIALNAGFQDYRDYAFQMRGRFDYGPEECFRFHEAIEKEIVPLLRELQEARRCSLMLPSLRPWDLAVDPTNQAPLAPFQNEAEMVEKTQSIFDRLDPEFSQDFRRMRDLRLLDLENRKGKAPGGYQSTLAESRLPFIFMNAVGVQRDVETLLHEAGHAFHALASRTEDLLAYRSAPIEFCEVASMSMELLGGEFLDAFYSTADACRARRDHLEGIVEVFPWIATVDAFQHWLYTHPGHTRSERCAAWTAVLGRFQGDVNWEGLGDAHERLWHRQLHLFLHPFYYIEYGIAQLGALQVWQQAKANRQEAVAHYKAALNLGGSRPLPELFQAAGCRFDFSTETVKPLVALLRKELAKQI